MALPLQTETLQSIASALWGDQNLWYLIGDANGLTLQDPLPVGQTLRIPERATVVHNTADTFKPYDAAAAIGDTTPLPVPGKAGGGCGVVGQVISVAIAVAVTVALSGAGTAALSSTMSSLFTGELAADIATGAVAAAAGSTASQAFNIATGMQSGFNWSAVATAAVSGGVTAGVSDALTGFKSLSSLNGWQGAAVRATISNTVAQGVGIVTGLQSGFDWRSVAVAGISAAVSQRVAGDAKGARTFAQSFQSSMAGATAAAIASGGRISLTQIAVDGFGNALGNSIAQQSQSRDPWKELDKLGTELATGQRFVSNSPTTNPLDFAAADAQPMRTDPTNLDGSPISSFVVFGKRPPSWFEENFVQPVEHALSETGHFIAGVGQAIGDGLSDLLAKPSGSTDEIPAQWNNWGRPSITGPIDYSHGSLRDLPIQTGPMLVPIDSAAEARAHAQALRNGNNLAMGLGGLFVAAPMSAARQLGLDETKVSEAGMLGQSLSEALGARGGARPTSISNRIPRSAVVEVTATSASNRTWANTLTNLRPTDPIVRQNVVRTLVQDDNGRYWLEGPTGRRITPSGSYDFVTMPNAEVRVTRPNTNPDFSTHLALSNGQEVNYAGSIRFGNNMGPNRGTISYWTNNSGHYRPPADMFGNADLPLNLFRRR
jgi:hypothetical protein